MASFRIEPLSVTQDRAGFCCGVAPLDRYFREQVGQDMRRRVTACFVALDHETHRIAGYYTLAAGSVPLVEVPETPKKRLPRYHAVPVARLGRLAVSLDYRGQRLGGALLWDALIRSSRSEVAVFAMLVDAKDDQAVAFYRHHGFVEFSDGTTQQAKRLMLPLSYMDCTKSGRP